MRVVSTKKRFTKCVQTYVAYHSNSSLVCFYKKKHQCYAHLAGRLG